MVDVPNGYGIATVTHHLSESSHPLLNVFLVALPDFETQDAADAVASAWSSNVMPELNDAVSMVQVHVEDAFSFGDNFGVVVGGESGDMSPPNVAYLAKKVSGFIGRANAGRIYIPGVTETHINDVGILDSTKFENLQDALNGLISDLQDALTAMHVNMTTPVLVNQLALEDQVATQRRRLR